jgi:hypothetical protein
MAGTYKVKRISKILESMTIADPITKPEVLPFNPTRPGKPLVGPGPKNNKTLPGVAPAPTTVPTTKPFNPSRPQKPSVDPGPKNYNNEINKVVDRYNKLIKAGMKPVKK